MNAARSANRVNGWADVPATTITVRGNRSGLRVIGPHEYAGGFPIPCADGQDGLFGGWSWDGNRLVAHVDRLGMFPLYYSELPDGIGISTTVEGLIRAGASSKIDWAALQLLLLTGFHVGCETTFRDIKTFPVGGRLEWEPGQLTIEERFPTLRPDPMSRTAAMDGYIQLFRQSIRKRLMPASPIRLPLSGGRDSRHILLELVAAGSPPETCYTSSAMTMRNDVLVARQLCSALGVEHSEVGPPHDLVAAELEKNARISFEATEHAWFWMVAKSMADPAAVTYDGIAGDVLSAGHFHDDENSRLYRDGRWEALAQRLAPLRRFPMIASRWQDEIAAANPHVALIQELQRYQGTHNPMMFFYLYNRSRRAVASGIIGLTGALMRAVFAPFLDRELFDFLAGMPESMFADKTFHTEAIARAFPKVANIAYAKKTRPSRSFFTRNAVQGIRFLVAADSSILLDRKAALLRLGRSLLDPFRSTESAWVMREALMLYQLGVLSQPQ